MDLVSDYLDGCTIAIQENHSGGGKKSIPSVFCVKLRKKAGELSSRRGEGISQT